MLRKWFSKRKVEVAETPQDDVDVVFNTQSDFDDVGMSSVESLNLEDDLEVSEANVETSDYEASNYQESEYEGSEYEDLSQDQSRITIHSSPLDNKPVSGLLPILATVLPLAVYVALLYLPQFDSSHMLVHGHFNVVSVVSILAGMIAFIIGLAGAKLRNIQVTLVSLAFISLGILFGLHGLTTPGFILGKNAVVAMSAPLSIILTLFWLYLSSLSSSTPLIRSIAKFHTWITPLWMGLLISLSALLIYQPSIANLIPLHLNPLRFLVGFVALELAIMTAWNYWRSYLYTRSPLQIAIVYSAGWLAVSAIIMSTGTLWHTSWWLYHGLLLFSVISMVVGLVLHYNRGRSLAFAFIGKGHKDPVERLEAAISPGVRHLIELTEQHDAYTAGHNHRVATIAVQIGEQMNLSANELRALAQGGIVHDMGKLNIPSEILNKPEKLEADERQLIETHPEKGYELAKRLGFMPQELDIIRYHHERWDGAGYPEKLTKEEIPLLARITAIADVYDALTSERAYRKPWSHDQTRTYILGQAGYQFDPACVEAWDKLNQAPAEDYADEGLDLVTSTIGANAV